MTDAPKPSNVVSITGSLAPAPVGEPRESLVSCLEEALRAARAGELQSFIGCGFTSTGLRFTIECDWHENVFVMLGSLAALQHAYVKRVSDANGQQL